MNRLEIFHQTFNESLAAIENFRIPGKLDDMSGFVEWLLTTDVNPYSFLPDYWANSFSSADSFAALLFHLHHALFDDGEITMFTLNGEPKIIFAHNIYSNFKELVRESFYPTSPPKNCEIEILKININDFPKLCDAYDLKSSKRAFAHDFAKFGEEFCLAHYGDKGCFDRKWIKECAGEIEKWQRFYG